MPLTKQNRKATFFIAATMLAAAVGGAVASKELVHSGASVRTASQQYGVDQAYAKAHPRRTITPYVGPFTFKGCGPAIAELDRALIRKHFRKAKPAPCYGKPTRRQVAAFQRSIHYKPTGRYTLATHRQLVARGGYTLKARGRLIVYAKDRYIQAYRNAVRRVTTHIALVGGSTLAYSQSGSRQYFGRGWPAIPPATDCSGMVIFAEWQSSKAAGIAVGYFGPGSTVGYTGTLAFAGRSVPLGAKLYPGDIALYGRYPFFHATIVVGNGLVMSHGGPGVNFLPVNYDGQLGSIRRLVG